ncbi:Transcription factor nsy-7 [Caenorhabditis elegans]|uniref:Isoform b of Transcription factor nsy-7 n=1 Tax=Caenorhabditis elegans TaxID=6239 RepID=H2KYW5-2|nr:Transcription factor nsy-7 [Caenorhabditis elegans]CCD65189.2 Transcription factor nsy-7 [Caenorhabditis elegans]|eukprot:NP_001255310.2 Neuronal SYmmetry [Caenorhabditis elegans]
MSSDTKYKYAVVRIPETSVVDFFSLIVAKGYSDVSFVASLSQCNLRDDPNDDQPTTSSNSVKESINDDESNSENNKLSPPRRQSNPHSSLPAISSSTVKNEPTDSWTPSALSNDPTPDLLSATVPAELLTNLFAKASGVDFDLSNNEWHENLRLPNGNGTEKYHPYGGNSKNDSPLQTRMKGWQREYIKEVIKDSHYPTEEELRDIEQKCDLSRKQILRFIAKRLTNPNRKPRVNHHDEKRKEQEERDSLADPDDDMINDNEAVTNLHHILNSLQETTA